MVYHNFKIFRGENLLGLMILLGSCNQHINESGPAGTEQTRFDENYEEKYSEIKVNKNRVADLLEQRLATIQPDSSTSEQAKLFSAGLLLDFYRVRDFQPAWTDNQNRSDAVLAIQHCYVDGLTAEDYHYETLKTLGGLTEDGQKADPAVFAEYDLLLTDAILLYSLHLLQGKVNPFTLDPQWSFQRRSIPENTAARLDSALVTHNLLETLDGYRPQRKRYYGLMQALAKYREIASKGDWQSINLENKLEPGDTTPIIPALRKRLLIEGDLIADHTEQPTTIERDPMAPLGPIATNHIEALSDTATTSMPLDSIVSETVTDTSAPYVYNSELVESVKRFQRRHGLNEDGVIGKQTVEAFNIPLNEKIEKLRINLERVRWVLHDLPDEYLAVNIASFRLHYVRGDTIAFTTRVMVGKTFHKTPIFRAPMKYIEFNPTWTVPRSITENEIIPKLKTDPTYLSRNNMVLLSGKSIVPASNVDFSQSSADNFPYVIRQEPGPNNSLGIVKFIFPNRNYVFLHDTPSKSLFSRSSRAFSHGCVRVQNPLELAGILLDDSPIDSDSIRTILKTRETDRIVRDDFPEVLILYWTAAADISGLVYFFNDVYERDAILLQQLNVSYTYDPLFSAY